MRPQDVLSSAVNVSRAGPAYQALAKGDIRQAVSLAQDLVRAHSSEPDFGYVLSDILLAGGVTEQALEIARNVFSATGRNHYHAHLARCLMKMGRFEEALNEALACLLNNPEQAATFDVLGNVFTGCGELEKALFAFEKAIEREPTALHLKFNLATALRGIGRMSDAENLYDEILGANPDDFEGWRNRSDLRKQTKDRNHIDGLRDILSKTQSNSRGRLQILGALAKEFSDLGEMDASFSNLKESADLRRSLMQYDVGGDVETMDRLRKAYGPQEFDRSEGHVTGEPIFILGLPRTGSTLLERMIGSHSKVFAAGELQNFAVEFVKLAKDAFPNDTLNKHSLVEKSVQLDFTQLGERYLSSTRPRTGGTERFIDKLPLNFLYIGLIAKALPGAKIIHLTRHPMDAAYAIYKTHFDQAYPYSYDLNDLGQYYVAYLKLMDHWRVVLPGRIHDTAYEDLVQDPEKELGAALEFCDLEFEQECLAFHESSAPTNTASAAQVRQPIYQTSVAKWRQVESGLLPFRRHLEDAGVTID